MQNALLIFLVVWLASSLLIWRRFNGNTLVKAVGGGFIASTALIGLTLALWMKSEPQKQPVAASPELAKTFSIDPLPLSTPPRPAHNYVMQDGLEYGYELALSDLDRQAGKAAAPLFVVRYLGERDGRHQIFHKASEALIEVYECHQPCEFATIYRFVNDEHVATERMRVASNTIAAAMFEDVRAGRLQQNLYLRGSKKMQGWVDKTGNMVFLTPT